LVVLIEIFQHNQQYDTLLPIIPCTHKLKAGIAYSSASLFPAEYQNPPRAFRRGWP
jgi:hypothetical protein